MIANTLGLLIAMMMSTGPKLSPFAGLPTFRQFVGNSLLFIFIPILSFSSLVEEETESMLFEESRDLFSLVYVMCVASVRLLLRS
jgi:hypothetical protein